MLGFVAAREPPIDVELVEGLQFAPQHPFSCGALGRDRPRPCIEPTVTSDRSDAEPIRRALNPSNARAVPIEQCDKLAWITFCEEGLFLGPQLFGIAAIVEAKIRSTRWTASLDRKDHKEGSAQHPNRQKMDSIRLRAPGIRCPRWPVHRPRSHQRRTGAYRSPTNTAKRRQLLDPVLFGARLRERERPVWVMGGKARNEHNWD